MPSYRPQSSFSTGSRLLVNNGNSKVIMRIIIAALCFLVVIVSVYNFRFVLSKMDGAAESAPEHDEKHASRHGGEDSPPPRQHRHHLSSTTNGYRINNKPPRETAIVAAKVAVLANEASIDDADEDVGGDGSDKMKQQNKNTQRSRRDVALSSVKSLPRLLPSHKDVLQWIPRVNGVVYVDDENVQTDNTDASPSSSSSCPSLQFDVMPSSLSSSNLGSSQQMLRKKKRQTGNKKSALLGFSFRQPTTVLRLCAAKSALPLLVETLRLNIIGVLGDDLQLEFNDRLDEQIELIENHLHFDQNHPHYHQYQMLLAERFATSIRFEVDLVTDANATTTTAATLPASRGGCDVSLFPLGPGAVFGSTDETSQLFEDESYSLIASATRRKTKKQQQQQPQRRLLNRPNIIIEANSVLGVHHALRSLFLYIKSSLRLREDAATVPTTTTSSSAPLPSSTAEPSSPTTPAPEPLPPLLQLPCLRIVNDAPTLGWRAQHVDIARHFFDANTVISDVLRPMAWAKMNVLHVHVSDDQGWRVESALLPALHQLGGRRGPPLNGQSSKKFVESKKYDAAAAFWSRRDVFDVVHAARARGIRVMPEVDMPAHASALLLAAEAEVLRFMRRKADTVGSSVEAQLRKRQEKSHTATFAGEKLLLSSSSSSSSSRLSHMHKTLVDKFIPRAAEAFDHAAQLLSKSNTAAEAAAENEADLVFGGEYSTTNAWRRSCFGTLINGNKDCLAGEHLKQDAQVLRLYKRSFADNNHNKDMMDFMSEDWMDSTKIAALSSASDVVRQFVSAHSAVNCMGGSHAIFDPTQHAANVLLLVLAEISVTFHEPLLYQAAAPTGNPPLQSAPSSSPRSPALFASSSFSSQVLFHFGADQAEFLRNFAWAPWIQRAESGEFAANNNNNNNNNRDAAVVVNGDEENDAAVAAAAANTKLKQKQKKKNKKKSADTDFYRSVCDAVARAHPTLVAGASYNDIQSAQPALMSFLIREIMEASGSWHLRGAVWDEALLDFAGASPPLPVGTVIVLWRCDGVSWNDVSRAVQSRQQAVAGVGPSSSSPPPPSPYPIVFADKTRLYFDYQQHPGGRSGNDGFTFNTFGPWIPFQASTLARVFQVPEVLPPELLFSCSSSPAPSVISARSAGKESQQQEQQQQLQRYTLKTLPLPKPIPGIDLIGIQSGLWSELLFSEEKLLYQLFPRMFAVAEVGWSTCLAGVTPTVRVSRHVSAAGVVPETTVRQQRRPAAGAAAADGVASSAASGSAAGEAEFLWWLQHDNCRVDDLIDEEAAVEAGARAHVGNKTERFSKWGKLIAARNARRDGDGGGRDHNDDVRDSDPVPALEPRCKSHDVTVPIMKSCKRARKQLDNEPPPIFDFWVSKLLCSAQVDH